MADRPFLRYFLPIMVAVIAVVAIAGTTVGWARTQNSRADIEAAQLDAIAGVGETLTRPIVDAAGDLAIVVRQPALVELPSKPSDADLDLVADLFIGLSDIRRVYDQVRLIDMSGVEIVRVDLADDGPFRVRDLQDKSGRYYFEESVVIDEGAIYVSPLDLNVENGKVEQPRTPMLRLATPVFGSDGRQRGVVVLNYLGEIALEALRQDARSIQDTFHLVNEFGYWMIAPDRDDEWGFMFGRPESSLAATDPEAGAAIAASSGGQFETASGLYTHRHLSPVGEIQAFLPEVVTADGRTLSWDAYSFVPIEALSSDRNNLVWQTFWFSLLAVIVLGLLAVLASSALARNWRNRFALQEAEFVFNASLEGIVVADADLRAVAINPAYTEITGYSEDATLGEPWRAMHSPLHDDGFYLSIRADLDQHAGWRGRIRTLRRDGTELIQALSVSVITDEGGDPERYVGVFTDATELVRRERELVDQATHDRLTGLANRPLIEATLDRELTRTWRTGSGLAVCFIDLDGFKETNDRLGHAAGDAVLREAAGRLRSVARESDTVGRLGGDEFVIVMADVGSRSEVELVVQRMIDSLREPIATTAGPGRVRASVGIAGANLPGVAPGEDPSVLMSLADAAMYAAKAAGGDQYRWAVPAAQ